MLLNPIALAGLVLACFLASPAPAAETPAVERILAKYVESLGGRPVIEKVKSRSFKGKIEIPGILVNSDWELLAKPANRVYSRWAMLGAGAVTDVFDGTNAWSKTPFEPLRSKTGDELAKTKRDADFYRDLRLKALFPDLKHQGAQRLDGEEVQVLESKPTQSSLERFYFSSKTGLLIGQHSEFQGPKGKVTVRTRFSAFGAVDGVRYPHVIECAMLLGTQNLGFTIKVAEIKHNVPLDDARFYKPSS